MSEPTYAITLWPNVVSVHDGKRVDVTWGELCERLSVKRRFAGEYDQPGWCAATFTDGHRRDESVDFLSMLVLDFDKDITLASVESFAQPYTGTYQTTRRHTPEAHRCRLIHPLRRPVTPSEYARLWEIFAIRCDNKCDTSGRNPSHYWYEPGTNNGHFEAKSWIGSAGAIDVDAILAANPEQPPAEPVQPKAPEITSAKSEGKRPYIDRFRAVNAIDPAEVVDAHKIQRDGKKFKCPSCGEGLKRTDCAIVKGGTKCSHERCSHQGKRPGFRTNVDLTMLMVKTDETGAVEWLENRFNIQPINGKSRGKNGNHYDGPPMWTDADEAERIAIQEADGIPADDTYDDGPAGEYERRQVNEKPTAADPLRGLKHLGKVAVYGRTRFKALASEPVNYVWQSIVVAATIVLVAGPPAEGKTTLLFLILAARLNTGEPVHLLGHEIRPAPKGQVVVLIEGEHGESSASRKVVGSLDLLGVDDGALDRLILVARRSVKLGSPEWADVVKLIRLGLVSDIAIDTIARVAPANPDSEQEQVAIFETIAAAIDAAPEDLKPVCWAAAHTRKSGTGGLADVSGSAQRTGQADTVLMLKADKSGGKVASVEVTFEKLREAPDDYPPPAVFAIGKNADGSPRLEQDLPSPDTDDERPLEQRILDLLAIEPRTNSALREKLKRSWKDIDAALTTLFGERLITTTSVDIRGRTFKAFTLRGEPANEPTLDSTPDSRIYA